MENRDPNSILSTPAETVTKFKRKVKKARENCSKLEQDIHGCDLELQKIRENTEDLERFIYLFSTLSSESVTSIVKELSEAEKLRKINLKLKKTLLLEKKMQFDYLEGKKEIEQKISLEYEEMLNESEANLEKAVKRMRGSVKQLEKEKKELENKNTEMETMHKDNNKGLVLYIKTKEELEQLAQARKACQELRLRQNAILTEVEIKPRKGFRLPFSCLCSTGGNIV